MDIYSRAYPNHGVSKRKVKVECAVMTSLSKGRRERAVPALKFRSYISNKRLFSLVL